MLLYIMCSCAAFSKKTIIFIITTKSIAVTICFLRTVAWSSFIMYIPKMTIHIFLYRQNKDIEYCNVNLNSSPLLILGI